MVASAIAFVLASWTARANAAASFVLEWSAPSDCPARESIVAATQASLGDSSAEPEPELLVQGTVTKDDRGFVVSLALHDPSGRSLGEREVRVEEQSCSAVEGPTALVLAMMIAVAGPAVAPAAAPEATPVAPAPGPPGGGPERPSSSVPSTHHPRFSLGAGSVASLGVLPIAGVGALLRATYLPAPRLLIGLEAGLEAGGSIRAGGGEADFYLFEGSLFVGIPALRAGPVELIPAVGARAGLVHAAPSGYTNPQDEWRPTLLVGPGALVRAKLTRRLFAEAFPQLEGVIVRDEFQLEGIDAQYPIHRASLIAGRLSLGLAYEFH